MERKSIDETPLDQPRKRRPSGAAVIRPDLTEALIRALFEEWSEMGYAAISLERVAARAGAGKAAIYRRWPSKREFASEAVEAVGLALADFADRGSLAADLRADLLATRRALKHRLVRRVLPDLLAERVCSGELAGVVDRLLAARRLHGEQLLDRAVARGELRAELDRALALDLIPAPLYWRMIVVGKRVTLADLDRQAVALVAALKAC